MAILRIASRARRRYGALLALSLMLGGVLFLVPSAVAVHDLGLFELDRNAQAEGTPGDDWATLFGGGGSQESFTGILADSALPGNQFQARRMISTSRSGCGKPASRSTRTTSRMPTRLPTRTPPTREATTSVT
jgi:hypothetical protein